MNFIEKHFLKLFSAYWFIAILTFGFAYNNIVHSCEYKVMKPKEFGPDKATDAGLQAMLDAGFWPSYLSVHLQALMWKDEEQCATK